ncbi:recombinase family protein [Pelagicoccus mobilis]|uniref:Recombinase family protein n=1 Tax=Pelagicoccus mobilis TaxID=415221 RepID=A0A934RVJ3_9BACT|nr:recombinase family protein [Pelagicoccus mobilis]MBK1877256.1 recombinase family protein [Pelagicoccus mobilis]
MRIAPTKYIAYYRVSTNQQGQSGLGLEAQKQAVLSHLGDNSSNIIESFVEVESGKRNSRPELSEAIRRCKREHATLIIAKLDRLARNVHFISGLMESRIDFVAADNPHANRLMIHMLAAFAEHEREQISIRTKAALAAAKERGVRLGANGKKLAAVNREAAEEFAQSILPEIRKIRSTGKTTLQDIANELNKRGIASYKNRKWYAATVARLLKRTKPRAPLQGCL